MFKRLICAIRGHRKWESTKKVPGTEFAPLSIGIRQGLKQDVLCIQLCSRCWQFYPEVRYDEPIPIRMTEHQEAARKQ